MFSAQAKGDGDPAKFQRYFVQHGRFTAGTAIRYAPSLITGVDQNQHLAMGFEIGTRFHSAPVIRLADAKPMHLGHVVKADGRWRLFLFVASGETAPADSLRPLCDWLADDPMCLLHPGEDTDAVLDVRAILRHPHRDVELMQMPGLLLPAKGRYGLTDYEKAFCPDPSADIFAMRSIAAQGCMVLVRPDQHVAHVLPLDGHEVLTRFLQQFLITPVV